AEAKEAEDVAMEVALGAITILRNESRLLQKGDKILLVVVDHTLQGAGGRNNQKISQLMHVELASRGFDNLETVALGYRPSTTEQSLVISKAKNSDVVLYLTRNATNEQAEFIRKLADKLMITVALQNPWDILQYPDVKVYLATYGYTEASIKALAMVLTGEKDATGKLPIAISESFPYGYSN
ncbi:MAG: hypothetical protein PHD88_09690, partial [Firmicutes bacterium]|nr:hypothetical protein [Bacillota bacterium]